MNPDEEASVAAMREALYHALLAHSNRGKAEKCRCSLCEMIRQALVPGVGAKFADRIRMECIEIVDFKRAQLQKCPELAAKTPAVHAVREVSEMLRSQLWSPGPEREQ